MPVSPGREDGQSLEAVAEDRVAGGYRREASVLRVGQHAAAELRDLKGMELLAYGSTVRASDGHREVAVAHQRSHTSGFGRTHHGAGVATAFRIETYVDRLQTWRRQCVGAMRVIRAEIVAQLVRDEAYIICRGRADEPEDLVDAEVP